MTTEGHARLRTAKLTALVRAHGGDPRPAPPFAPGAAVLTDDATWLLLADDPVRAVGAALAWAAKHGAGQLHLVVDDPDDAARVARRAAAFADPVRVWRADPAGLVAVDPAPPVPVGEVPSPEAELYAALFAEVGLDFVLEHGVVTAELLGLEVARLVADDPTAWSGPSVDDAGHLQLRVGVGRLDQEAGEYLNVHVTDAEALAKAADVVRVHRRAGAEPHPLNGLVPERWLRRVLQAHPDLVGCAELRPVPPEPARRNLRERGVAPLVGVDTSGRDVVVVCSAGTDLEAVPAAADARAAHAPTARLVVAVPEADVHPVVVALAARLADPAEVVGVPEGWRALPAEPRRPDLGGVARG